MASSAYLPSPFRRLEKRAEVQCTPTIFGVLMLTGMYPFFSRWSQQRWTSACKLDQIRESSLILAESLF
jgi:hypothetical protein